MLRAVEYGDVTRIELARTFLGRPQYRVMIYLLDGLLIDTGCPATARELLAFLRPRLLRQVVNTHYHEDHSGGNALLQRALGVPVVVPEASRATLGRFYRLPLYRWLVWGQPQDVTAAPLGEVVETGRFTLQVIPTPGHAADHVCLFEPERGWLFSGDLFIHERVRYMRPVEDPWKIIESLRRVMALAPRRMFCSHAGVIDDPRAAIEGKIAFWERLADRARSLSKEGLSVRRITRRLLGREGTMRYLSGGEFSKSNLIRSLLHDAAAPAAGAHATMTRAQRDAHGEGRTL